MLEVKDREKVSPPKRRPLQGHGQKNSTLAPKRSPGGDRQFPCLNSCRCIVRLGWPSEILVCLSRRPVDCDGHQAEEDHIGGGARCFPVPVTGQIATCLT